jgi:hypothetical protein
MILDEVAALRKPGDSSLFTGITGLFYGINQGR